MRGSPLPGKVYEIAESSNSVKDFRISEEISGFWEI